MNKYPSTKKTVISLFLSVILVTGTIALSSSSSFITGTDAQAQSSYYNNGIDNNYKFQKESINLNKIKCINNNVNVNGINSGDVNVGNKGQGYIGADSDTGYYNDGYGNNNKQCKGFDDCVINNNNSNTNRAISEGNQTIPEPEPTTASLTVKKQVFGCDRILGPMDRMTCNLQNNSSDWLDCNNNPAISGSVFCQSLPESIFDIEVLDDQDTQIQQFEGSEQGTTIQNLEPGTYTVNEIKHLSSIGQLGNNPVAVDRCTSTGFPDGGDVTVPMVMYQPICFEYEDEQGNDCSTITLAAGEERTCIVKNYIWDAFSRR